MSRPLGPHIETSNAWVEFPIFDAKSRSLKKAVLGKAGGTIGRNNSNVIVIEAFVKRLRSRMGVLGGTARVDGKIAVEGLMTFALGSRIGSPEPISASTPPSRF